MIIDQGRPKNLGGRDLVYLFDFIILGIKNQREGIAIYSANLSILNISSYSHWTIFWDAKILRTQEIMTLIKNDI